MVTRRAILTAVPTLAAALTLPRRAFCEPRVGMPFPAFTIRALDDHIRTQRDLQGRRSFVAAMTGLDAQNEMAQWLAIAEARLGQGRGNIFSFVALRLGFYAWDGIVRSETRRRSPHYRWPNVYIDRDGNFQQALGLPNDQRLPWIYVVEANGIVSVAVHANASHPSAQQVWTQMAAP